MNSRSDLIDAVNRAGILTKLYCGIANNAAWTIALEAIDHARACQGFREATKQLYNRCRDAWHAYEVGLVYSSHSRAFSVSAMPPDVRKRYGNITDREYYEFWASTGATLYSQHRPIVTSLWNKYRIPLERQHVKDAEHIAWVFTAQAALILAETTYQTQVEIAATEGGIRRSMLSAMLRQFSIRRVAQTWEKATLSLFPRLNDLVQTPTEDKNIESGLEQVYETWMNLDNITQAYMTTAEDYPEMFRTKGEMQKALRQISEIAADR